MSQTFHTGWRAYYRQGPLGGSRFFPPVIKGLLALNTAVFLAHWLFFERLTFHGVPLEYWFTRYLALIPLGGFAFAPGFEASFQPWQLVTYLFIHGNFMHLFFNMLALWMFGMELENSWGSRKFALYYFLCGVGAAVTHLLVAPFVGQGAPTVGASGAVFGVLLAFGMLFPERPIYIYFLLPVKAKYFVAAYMAMELFYGVTGTTDGIAHFAHLGGALVGLAFLIREMGFGPLGNLFSRRHTGDSSGWRGMRRSFRSSRGGSDVQDATFFDIETGKPYHKSDQEVNQETVDAILDKISREGYQSLTDEEKRVLNEASKKIH